jgi:hypothetical protein
MKGSDALVWLSYISLRLFHEDRPGPVVVDVNVTLLYFMLPFLFQKKDTS